MTIDPSTAAVTLPTWLFTILVILAAWAVLERFLIPSVRWALRRRVENLLGELDRRLHIRIQPFKLTRRKSLVERLIHDARIAEVVEQHARENDETVESVRRRVQVYAEEIVPAFNAWVYFRFAYGLGRRLARWIFRVRIGYSDTEALTAIRPDSTVVFVMNHRSNMDYVLVAYLAAEKTALSYAVGEWARIWPLQTLLKALGAFFVRRNSADPLYRAVLSRYIRIAAQEGVTQAMFPEGQLTRSGELGSPKLGLLDYLVRDYDPDGDRDIVFIPVGINYDRTLEDRTLLLSEHPEMPRRYSGSVISNTLRFLGTNLKLLFEGRWHRFGYACVNFGTPVSLIEYLQKREIRPRTLERAARFQEVGRLAEELMTRVAAAVPVVPVPVVATIVLNSGSAALSELEIKSRSFRLLQQLEEAGAHVYIPRRDRDYAVGVGLRMLTLRKMVQEQDGLYRVDPAHEPLLKYYAGSILQFTDTTEEP